MILAQHFRAPTYQHLGASCTAGREEMIAFVWYEHQPCLSAAPLRLVFKLPLCPHVGLLCGFKASRPMAARCTYSPASHWSSGVGSVIHGAACQSIPRGVKRWQMPVLLGPLPVNRAGNGCLISSEWLFSPVQTICYHHVVMRAYIKQRKKGSMQTVVTLQPVVFLYIWAYAARTQKELVHLYHTPIDLF